MRCLGKVHGASRLRDLWMLTEGLNASYTCLRSPETTSGNSGIAQWSGAVGSHRLCQSPMQGMGGTLRMRAFLQQGYLPGCTIDVKAGLRR